MTNILKIQEKIKNFKIMLPSLQNLGCKLGNTPKFSYFSDSYHFKNLFVAKSFI